MYFRSEVTGKNQWNFPREFDHENRKKTSIFTTDWKRKKDLNGRTYWEHKESALRQNVNPNSETYLLEAAILGNIAFLNLYLKYGGELTTLDQRGRTGI